MALSKTTKDHDEIKQWAESRGAVPAEVESTESKGGPGILRFMFPKAPHHNDGALKEIEWDDFLEKFDANGLELIYQDVTAEGAESNFNKLVYPENESSSVKKAAGKRATAKKSAKTAATTKTAFKSGARKAAATNATAKKAAPAKKTSGTSASARKSVPAKKSVPVKKSAAKKSLAKKAAPAKKGTAKKAGPAKKSPAKKSSSAKKAVNLKASARKSSARGLWSGA